MDKRRAERAFAPAGLPGQQQRGVIFGDNCRMDNEKLMTMLGNAPIQAPLEHGEGLFQGQGLEGLVAVEKKKGLGP